MWDKLQARLWRRKFIGFLEVGTCPSWVLKDEEEWSRREGRRSVDQTMATSGKGEAHGKASRGEGVRQVPGIAPEASPLPFPLLWVIFHQTFAWLNFHIIQVFSTKNTTLTPPSKGASHLIPDPLYTIFPFCFLYTTLYIFSGSACSRMEVPSGQRPRCFLFPALFLIPRIEPGVWQVLNK